MKRTIQDTNFVTIQGWVVNHLHLSSDEAIIYSLIYGYKEGFSEPVSYIAQWVGKSEMTVRRTLQRLIQIGYISKKTRSGKPTSYTCTPLTNCEGSQNVTPNKNDSTPLTNCEGLYNNYNNITTTTTPARMHARERLKKWIAESNIKEWTELQFARNEMLVDLDKFIDEFYDDDFKVRERCERGERMEVLTHFQYRVQKHIREEKEKLKNEQNNGNNHTSTKTSRNSGIISPEDFARSFGLGWNIGKREQ